MVGHVAPVDLGYRVVDRGLHVAHIDQALHVVWGREAIVWTAIAFQHPTALGMIAPFGMTVAGHAGTACVADADAEDGSAAAAMASASAMLALTGRW